MNNSLVSIVITVWLFWFVITYSRQIDTMLEAIASAF